MKPVLFENSDQQDVELPTLLHFSAKYGLKKLTSTLLQCPGALQAYSIANKNGDYPNTLAERNGFPDLRQFIDDYVVSAQQFFVQISIFASQKLFITRNFMVPFLSDS